MTTRKILFVTTCACLCATTSHAEDVGKVFEIGEVNASAPAPDSGSLGGTTLTQDEIQLFNRDTLDKAIQLVPGASVSEMGARNETDIWIRGFDRWRVPLYIDGIPVYLPVDNRVDFSRLSTSTYSEIQVSKGFTSVIDGPGAMGGAVNLVSREVTKPFEGDARIGSSFDGNGALNGEIADVFAGTRQGDWFLQSAATGTYKNHFRLSDDFSAGTFENGGNRNRSYHEDFDLNTKAGYKPNAQDEYSLNLIIHVGQKDNPVPDTLIPPANLASQKFWTWPSWDKQSLYYLSRTSLDDAGSYVKFRAYIDRFYNALDSFDSAAYTTQNSPKSFNSKYDDRAAGGSAELSEMLLNGLDNLKFALHYRFDQHNGWNATNAKFGVWYTQPWLRDEENTYSAAIENTFHPAPKWDVTEGVSFDYRQVLGAQDFDAFKIVPASPPYGAVVNYPVGNNRAWNPEFAVAYHFDETGTVHGSVTERTRFPTLFEMFSSRFGTFTGNPYLQPETSDNFEIGAKDTVGQTKLGANIFYSRVRNAIGSVPVVLPVVGATSQNQNTGIETHKGFELEASSQILEQLETGANYAFLQRTNVNGFAVPADTPKHKFFVYAVWKPSSKWSVVPSFEFDSKRWFQSVANNVIYFRSGDFATANIKLAYEIVESTKLEFGVNNISDANYQIEDGYHAEGRNFFTNLRMQF